MMTQHSRRTLTRIDPEDRLECLRRSIEHSAHLLPAQGPITVFVHHNTLHALEELPFERAVVEGAQIFGCHPFLPEERYRRELARGRIHLEDVEAVLMEDLGDDADVLLGFLGTRFHLRRSMIGHALRIAETDSFSSLERRRILHLAYERRYRHQTLDAVAAHGRPRLGKADEGASKKTVPSFQIVCCIDEREESFRRHLEEIAPNCETFGAAGFFAVAIYYRGAADAHYTPLCPVIIKPEHYVAEDVVYSLEYAERRRRKTRRTIGTVTHRVHAGSRTFAGGWLTGLFGSLASIPLVMRILFPRATAQIRRVFGSLVQPPAVTKLELERSEESPGPENGHIGYSMPEMAVIVERLLRDMGLTTNFSRLVIITGHGSASLNNPHEAAHDCGACGGGRGGPNARAFAQMANDIRVRERLAANGLRLPEQTVFVGAYHNTCDDSITYYDLDRLPSTHKPDFERAGEAIDLARQRSAHERCRRFESAPLQMTPEAALRHVEGRAEDLSQVRPEYGHATNALCFVGRRQWSRGLFLDRRAFLQSYDPAQDDEQRTILTRILQAVIPVCAGINLEYYFSFVDPTGYGCGTKLPHNIVSLIGVMNGAASDLRPGLPWQMTEIHEPVRLLFVTLEVRGLESHRQLSEHPKAARRRAMSRLRRVTVVAGSDLQDQLACKFVELGASGYTAIPCSGAGRSAIAVGGGAQNSQVRLEAIVPGDVAEAILEYLRREIPADQHVTACVETVEVLRVDQF